MAIVFDLAAAASHIDCVQTDASRPAPHAPFDRRMMALRLARAVRDGPADFLLERAAADLIDRLNLILRDFTSVLDLGTPGPVLARALLGRTPAGGLFRAAPMRASDPAQGHEILADEEALPFRPAAFDLVVSALALHRVNDLPGTLVQIRRALKPDGLFLACLAGGRTLHELRHAFAAAEAEISGGASPRVAPFADVRDMGGLLQRAGFALPVADLDTIVVRYDHLFGLMRDLRAMGATNALVDRSRRFLRRDVMARAAAIYAERFADPDGRVRATFEWIWLSGWVPHESQRKPLKPGSARMRLADALRPGGS